MRISFPKMRKQRKWIVDTTHERESQLILHDLPEQEDYRDWGGVQEIKNGMNLPMFTKVNVFIAMLYLPNIILLVICHHAMEKQMEIINIFKDVMLIINVRMVWLLQLNVQTVRFLML